MISHGLSLLVAVFGAGCGPRITLQTEALPATGCTDACSVNDEVTLKVLVLPSYLPVSDGSDQASRPVIVTLNVDRGGTLSTNVCATMGNGGSATGQPCLADPSHPEKPITFKATASGTSTISATGDVLAGLVATKVITVCESGGTHGICSCTCADLSTPATCGSCDVKCAENAVCSPASSAASFMCACPEGSSLCLAATGSAACVPLESDFQNCGACGTVCPQGGTCSSGACMCPDGQEICGRTSSAAGRCTNVHGTDAANCGACGVSCSGKCLDGKCE